MLKKISFNEETVKKEIYCQKKVPADIDDEEKKRVYIKKSAGKKEDKGSREKAM